MKLELAPRDHGYASAQQSSCSSHYMSVQTQIIYIVTDRASSHGAINDSHRSMSAKTMGSTTMLQILLLYAMKQ